MATPREIKDMLAALVRLLQYTRDIDTVRSGRLFDAAREMVENARKGNAAPVPWTPLRKTQAIRPTQAHIAAVATQTGVPEPEVREAFNRAMEEEDIWANSQYQVSVREVGDRFCHLSVKRLDQQPVRDWRDLQRIKNELVGAECEAVELYPATSRLVDSANQFHLWASRDPAFRFPFGFAERLVTSGSGPHDQRPHET